MIPDEACESAEFFVAMSHSKLLKHWAQSMLLGVPVTITTKHCVVPPLILISHRDMNSCRRLKWVSEIEEGSFSRYNLLKQHAYQACKSETSLACVHSLKAEVYKSCDFQGSFQQS